MTSILATTRTLEPPAGAMPEPLAKPADVMAAAAAAASKVETLRIPHITIHGFCETPSLASAMEGAVADRRMVRASAKLLRGGIAAAMDLYQQGDAAQLDHHRKPRLHRRALCAARCSGGTVCRGYKGNHYRFRE